MTTTKKTFTPFSLGQIVATRGALDAIPSARMQACLLRHCRGDWGCCLSH